MPEKRNYRITLKDPIQFRGYEGDSEPTNAFYNTATDILICIRDITEIIESLPYTNNRILSCVEVESEK